MQTTKREQASLADRFFTALLSCLLTLVAGLLLSFVLMRQRSGVGLYFGYWQLVFGVSAVASVIGFIVGSRKMAEIFGFFFRTNKPKDGHWY